MYFAKIAIFFFFFKIYENLLSASTEMDCVEKKNYKFKSENQMTIFIRLSTIIVKFEYGVFVIAMTWNSTRSKNTNIFYLAVRTMKNIKSN